MNKLPAQAHTTVHIPRTPDEVLDYLEASSGPKLGVDLSIDRDERSAYGGIIMNTASFDGSKVPMWSVDIKLAGIGGGTKVEISVLQFNDSFFQRKAGGRKVQAYVDYVASLIHSDLGS